jgi:hypothetical protein
MWNSVLFWNIAKKCSYEIIDEATKSLNPDFLIIAEDCLNTNELLVTLNTNSKKVYQFCSKNERGISIFTSRHFTEFSVLKSNSPYLLPIEIDFNSRKTLLIGIHLPSKLRTDNNERQFIGRKTIKEITRLENECGHKNTVLVGDFNMNPFEDGMVEVDAFNAVMSVDIAKKGSRRYLGRVYEYFYNPMWGHFGDISNSPSGTYFYSASDYKNKYYWNIFDQVLVRPEIIDNFDLNSLSIIESFGNERKINLLTRHRSIKIDKSDHLPLYFTIKL